MTIAETIVNAFMLIGAGALITVLMVGLFAPHLLVGAII